MFFVGFDFFPPTFPRGGEVALEGDLISDIMKGGAFGFLVGDSVVEKFHEVVCPRLRAARACDEVVGVASTGEADVEFTELLVAGLRLELGAMLEELLVAFGDGFARQVVDPFHFARFAIALYPHPTTGGSKRVATELREDGHVEGESLGHVDGHHLDGALGIGFA